MSVRPRYLGIDHLGIAVPALDAIREIFTGALGFEPGEEERVPEQKVRVLKLDAGGADLEFLESTDPEGPIAKYLDRKGPGIHHVAIRVSDLAATLLELEEAGVRLIDRKPRRGAEGKKIAFLHPKSTGGILIELCEADAPAEGE